MKRFRIAANALLMVGLAACSSLDELTDLEVPNENNPDRERVLSQATDIEGVIGGAMLVWWGGSQYSSPSWALSTAADEGSMSWGNFGMQQLSSEPRVAWPNDPAWTYRGTTQTPWYGNYGALSSVYDGLTSIAGNDEAASQIDVNRAKAFAKLVQGMAHGYLSTFYDSAFVFDETVDLEKDILTLKPYPDVYAAAMAELQEAVSIASANSFTIQDEWFDGNPMTNTQLARFAHSVMARLMTQVPRSPAERAAVDWNAVISHVDAGITSDIQVQGKGAFERFWKALEWYGYQVSNTTWARGDYKTIGWLDTSGRFATWLATPVAKRNEFLLDTPDRRITGAGGNKTDGTDFKYMGPSRFPSARGTYHYSFYGGKRFANYAQSNATIPARWMTTVEMQLIKAEGLLRTGGSKQAVADIINATRVTRGKLPPALATDTDLMDKLIYEKRIEAYLLCSGCAYFDRRGFGPIAPTGPAFHQGPVEGTPTHFAPPGLELNVLQKPLYTYGGAGNEGGTLQPSGAPGLHVATSGTRVPASLVYMPAARRGGSEFSPGAAALAGQRYY